MTTYKEKYHLKKVETLKTRPRIGYPQTNKPQLKAEKATTLKSLAIKNKTHNRDKISNFTEDNIQDNNKTADNFYLNKKIQKNSVSQNQIPQRHNQMSKVKKFDLVNRNKSLNYWKRDNRNIDFNIISSVKTFINKIIRPNNGCICEEPCIWALKMVKWVDVPQGLMHKHYNKLLQKTVKKDKNEEDMFQYYQEKWQAKEAEQRQKLFKQIKKDINRTQHQSPTFQNQVFRQRLQNILKCYTIQDPPIGYIQGMNMILSGILYHIKDQARSYCVFRRILFLMRSVYQQNFKECYFHIGQIKNLIQHQVADIYQLFEELGIQFQIICLPWILSLLTSIVPLNYLHLIYDGYIKQKWKFIYKVSLSIFIYHKQAIKQLNQAGQIMVLLSSGSQFHKQVNWQDLVQFANKLQLEQTH